MKNDQSLKTSNATPTAQKATGSAQTLALDAHDNKLTKTNKELSVTFPIASKLILLTSMILILAGYWVIRQSTDTFTSKLKSREEDQSMEEATNLASQVSNVLQNVYEKARVVASVLYQGQGNDSGKALSLTFTSDPDLVSVEVITRTADNFQTLRRVVNGEYLIKYQSQETYIQELRDRSRGLFQGAFAGESEVRNYSRLKSVPLITMAAPLVIDEKGSVTHIVVADFRLERISKIFSESQYRTRFLLDREGGILAHPDENIMRAENNSTLTQVSEWVLISKNRVFQKWIDDASAKDRLLSSAVKSDFGVTVVSQVPESVLLEPTVVVRRDAFFVTGLTFWGAILILYFWSSTLTHPLEKLAKLSLQVAKGNLEINAGETTRDEVGVLAQAFNSMVRGLKERERIKVAFGKFHGTAIAQKLLSGDLSLGGEQVRGTVLFIDIRNFVQHCDHMKPQEVVDLLNEFFGLLVFTIECHGGVVDKFVGDAVMAIWGVTDPDGKESLRALAAALDVRKTIVGFNEDRIAKGLKPIYIGMGLHTGELIAGRIGSENRMDYTVIGDSVNLASRIQHATKTLGVDLLVSETVFEEGKIRFKMEEASRLKVRGKDQLVPAYMVLGYYEDNGEFTEVETKYSHYKPDELSPTG